MSYNFGNNDVTVPNVYGNLEGIRSIEKSTLDQDVLAQYFPILEGTNPEGELLLELGKELRNPLSEAKRQVLIFLIQEYIIRASHSIIQYVEKFRLTYIDIMEKLLAIKAEVRLHGYERQYPVIAGLTNKHIDEVTWRDRLDVVKSGTFLLNPDQLDAVKLYHERENVEKKRMQQGNDMITMAVSQIDSFLAFMQKVSTLLTSIGGERYKVENYMSQSSFVLIKNSLLAIKTIDIKPEGYLTNEEVTGFLIALIKFNPTGLNK